MANPNGFYFPYFPPPSPPPPSTKPPSQSTPPPPPAAKPPRPSTLPPPPPSAKPPSQLTPPPPPTAKPPRPSIPPPPPPGAKPPSHSTPPPPFAKPPSHSTPPPPHQPFRPPPPHQPFRPPPPPHIRPPPPQLPPPPSPDNNPTVIVIVIISLGSVFFLAFLAVALLCFIKRRKKKTVQETDMIHIDKHRTIKEAIVEGPHGPQAVVVSVEDNVHIDEEKMKNETFFHEGLHGKVKSSDVQAEAEIINFDGHWNVKEDIVEGPHGSKAVVLTIDDDVHIDEVIRKNERIGKGLHGSSEAVKDKPSTSTSDSGQ